MSDLLYEGQIVGHLKIQPLHLLRIYTIRVLTLLQPGVFMDEHQAILSLKRGQIQALEYLVEVYQVKAMRAAFLITNDQKLAEDLVQEAFLRAYECIHQFDES